jgi:hypothetical protein
MIVHRTVCAAHFEDATSLFAEGRRIMPERYRVHASLNASLPVNLVPEEVMAQLDRLYNRMTTLSSLGFQRIAPYPGQGDRVMFYTSKEGK